MFDLFDPSPPEIFQRTTQQIKDEILAIAKGQTLTRRDIHAHILRAGEWFGVFKKPHLTRALKELQAEGNIITRDGNVSDDTTRFTFRG